MFAPGASLTGSRTRSRSRSSRDRWRRRRPPAARCGRGAGARRLAVVGATVVGWNEGFLDALVTPPPLRAGLVGGSVGLGAVVLLARSVTRLAEASERDVPALIRAVRLAFLAVAAFAAAAGWAIGHPLPPHHRGGHRRDRRARDIVPAPRRRATLTSPAQAQALSASASVASVGVEPRPSRALPQAAYGGSR